MAVTSASGDRIVLSDGTINADASRTASLISSAAPMILCLAAPILVMMLIDPSILRHASFLLLAILVPMLLVSVGIYIFSVLNPGDIAGVIADAGRREVDLLHANAFATRRTTIAFADIANVRLIAAYDRDGYATERGELLKVNGERVLLPVGIDGAEISALKGIIRR